jgi:hypothetical protein
MPKSKKGVGSTNEIGVIVRSGTRVIGGVLSSGTAGTGACSCLLFDDCPECNERQDGHYMAKRYRSGHQSGEDSGPSSSRRVLVHDRLGGKQKA